KTHEEHSQQIDLRLNSSGTARITLYAPVDQPFPSLACNDEVRATVSLHQEERYLDPGVWDANEYLHEQGIGALGSVTPQRLAVITRGRKQDLPCRFHS